MNRPADSDEQNAHAAPPGLLFATRRFHVLAMRAAEVPELQGFFELNPEYFYTVGDQAPGPAEAQQEFADRPPAEFSYSRHQAALIRDAQGQLSGIYVLSWDLFAAGVCHIGLFLIATALHGKGAAQELSAGLEALARAQGSRWLRLGVVAGNARAERFWAAQGFVELRQRHGVTIGRRVNSLRVMLKPLTAEHSVADYLALVARDRPEA